MYGERPLTRCFGGVVFVIDGYTRGFRCRPNLDLLSNAATPFPPDF